jgi:hypothetical protein
VPLIEKIMINPSTLITIVTNEAAISAASNTNDQRERIRAYCRETFDWSVIGPKYEAMLYDIVCGVRK